MYQHAVRDYAPGEGALMDEQKNWVTVSIYFQNGEKTAFYLRGEVDDVHHDLARNGRVTDADGDILTINPELIACWFVSPGRK